jgi:alkaline phosphatase
MSTSVASPGDKKSTKPLNIEFFIYLHQTYNSDRWVADSSGAATAILCGEKTNFYTVGVSDEVKMSNCTNVNEETKLKSALKYAIDAGECCSFRMCFILFATLENIIHLITRPALEILDSLAPFGRE